MKGKGDFNFSLKQQMFSKQWLHHFVEKIYITKIRLSALLFLFVDESSTNDWENYSTHVRLQKENTQPIDKEGRSSKCEKQLGSKENGKGKRKRNLKQSKKMKNTLEKRYYFESISFLYPHSQR